MNPSGFPGHNRRTKNAFEDLMENLHNGKLRHTQLQIAYRAWIRESKRFPEGIKDLLAGQGEAYSGVLFTAFKLISQIVGAVETAYRRGYAAGQEDAAKCRKRPKRRAAK